MEKPRASHQMLFFLLLLGILGFCTLVAVTRQSPSDRETMIAWLRDNQEVLPEILSYLQDEQTTMTRETFQQFDQLYRSGVLSEVSSVSPKGRLIVRFNGGTTASGERYLHYAPDCDDLSQLNPLSPAQSADFAIVEQDSQHCLMTDGTASIRIDFVEAGWYIVDYQRQQ